MEYYDISHDSNYTVEPGRMLQFSQNVVFKRTVKKYIDSNYGYDGVVGLAAPPKEGEGSLPDPSPSNSDSLDQQIEAALRVEVPTCMPERIEGVGEPEEQEEPAEEQEQGYNTDDDDESDDNESEGDGEDFTEEAETEAECHTVSLTKNAKVVLIQTVNQKTDGM